MNAHWIILTAGLTLALISLIIAWAAAYRRATQAELALSQSLPAAEERAARYEDEARRARRDTTDAYRILTQHVPPAEIAAAAIPASETADPAKQAWDLDPTFVRYLNDFDEAGR